MNYKTYITKHNIVAARTHQVILQRPKDFQFTAGQYLQLAVPTLTYTDPKGGSRVFSIMSAPQDTQTLSVVFRDSGSGFKKTLMELSIGAEVYLEGPLGGFVYPKGSTQKQIYIAGGVGIAPFISMIAYRAAHTQESALVTLIYANRSKETAAFLEYFQGLDANEEWFTLQEVYGKFQQEVLQEHAIKHPDASWMLVGPPPMVMHTQALLQGIGILEKNIRVESFTGY